MEIKTKVNTDCSIIYLFNPLEVANGGWCPTYSIYIEKYKNGKKKIKAYDGMARLPFICLRSTTLTPQQFLDIYFPTYTEKRGWVIHTI